MNLQKFIVTNFKVCRNAHVIRVRKTLKRNLDTDRFGMMEFNLEGRKRILKGLTTSALDRSSDGFKVVKPLFYCMASSREKKTMFEFGQGNNLGKHAK